MYGGLKAERKEMEAQIKTQMESLKKDEESYKEASSKLAERKEALESKIKAESQTHKSAEQKAAFDKEVKEERAKIKEQERFLDDKAAQIEEKDYKLKQTQEKKKEYKKKEDKAKKKQSAKLNAASVLKVKKDISNELGGGGANTGDAFHDGKGGLVGTFLEVINPMHYVKALLAKLGALLAPYVVIFATISIIVVVIFAILFDVLSPIVKVTEALNNIIGFFTGDDTFVNTTLDQATIDQIVADSGCNETQEATLRFALSKVGYPYSQAQRASGNAYDCSSLAYYAWEAAGVDDAHDRAKFWHLWAMILMVLVGGFAVYAFIITVNADTSWVKLVAKIFATTTLVTAAAYAARQASKQEKVERYARKIEMELVAIDPFIQSLEQEHQSMVKEEIARKIFGNADAMEISQKDEPYKAMDKLTSIEESMQSLVSLLGKISK